VSHEHDTIVVMYSPYAASVDSYMGIPPFHHHHHHHHHHLHHHMMQHFVHNMPQSNSLAMPQPFMMPTLHTPAGRMRTTPGQTPSRTVPTQWSQPQQPYTLTQQLNSASKAATKQSHTAGERSSEKLVSTMMPDKAGKGLERDLSNATPEELMQILLDLSSCNPQAAAFINTKAQLFALRRPQVLAEFPPNVSVGQMSGTTPVAHSVRETPSKALSLDDSMQHHNTSLTHRSPLQTLQSALHDRHVVPESRGFAAEMHPCIRLYGACRHATNCPFKTLPKNVCLNWVRNSCTNMNDCPAVHRLPADCPVQVTMVFELSRGMDRVVMAKKAQSLMLASEPSMPESQGGLMMDAVDPAQCITPRGQRTVEITPGSAIEHAADDHDGSREVNCARCLNDSLELAAGDSCS
jgi:hypothetical protein